MPHPAPESVSGPCGAWCELDHAGRQARIVACAIERLEAGGMEAVTMRRLAEALGMGTMTLYTYFENRSALLRAMIREGFARLSAACEAASTLRTESSWRGGARAYLHFATDHPALYKLLFDFPLEPDPGGEDLVAAGMAPLLGKVRARLEARGELAGAALERRARRDTARFWIALHGLASLAIADRLAATGSDLETLLEELLDRVAPD